VQKGERLLPRSRRARAGERDEVLEKPKDCLPARFADWRETKHLRTKPTMQNCLKFGENLINVAIPSPARQNPVGKVQRLSGQRLSLISPRHGEGIVQTANGAQNVCTEAPGGKSRRRQQNPQGSKGCEGSNPYVRTAFAQSCFARKSHRAKRVLR
jgi:hypothetical protein